MTQTQTHIPDVGDSAPEFTLKDSSMNDIRLQDFRGQTVILVFFPAAFSGTCTKEVCAFRDSMGRLNSANAQVLGISVDLPYSLREFKKALNLNFSLLSDFDRNVIADYGVVDDNFNGFRSGVARRSVFVTNADGDVTWRWLADKSGEQPDYETVMVAATGS